MNPVRYLTSSDGSIGQMVRHIVFNGTTLILALSFMPNRANSPSDAHALPPNKATNWQLITWNQDQEEVKSHTNQEQASQEKWLARGTIVDGAGNPLSGVQVWANTGWGTLRRTGQAVTNDNGRYELEFGPGIRFTEGDDLFRVQAATIFAAKDGFVEQNLCRAGDRLMAAKMPTEDSAWGTVTQMKDKIIVKGNPVTIDFVMIPAGRIEGYLVDDQGKLLQNRSVSLTGPELPPSSSVLDQVYTDRGGKFSINDIPVGKKWQFEVRTPKSPKLLSGEFQLAGTDVEKVLLTVDFGKEPPSLTRSQLSDELERRLSGRAIELRDAPAIRGTLPPERDQRDLAWDEPKNGLQAALHILGDKKVSAGDIMKIEMVIRNTGDETVRFESSRWRQEDELMVWEVEQGKSMEVSTAWYSGWPVINTYELRAGEEVVIDAGDIAIVGPGDEMHKAEHPAVYFAKLPTGSYRFRFRLYLPDISRFNAHEGHWKGRLYTGDVEVKVKL